MNLEKVKARLQESLFNIHPLSPPFPLLLFTGT